MTDDVSKKHLEGMCSVGIYPMLPDEICYFLAVDFDGEGWIDNIGAFKENCSQKNIPVSIERAKSGNGAHAWIFFEEKIPAALARKLGSFIITETMSKRYQLTMKSYDRLFPNQDTLPKGGFGNLIALPFQKDSVSRGNSVFIDDNNNPYPDQWKFLSSTRKMTLLEIEKISHEAIVGEQILGVRMSPTDERDPPWMVLPSGKRRFKPVIKDLPHEIEVVIANKILKNDIGVFVAPPGSGKTVVSIYAIAKRKVNTLILLHRKPLIEQWRMRLGSFLGLSLKDIGQIGGGKNNPNGMLDIAMIQSMERKGVVDDRIADYGFVIVDECHHVSAVSFERVLMQAKAKYILGLTATPYRRDGPQPIIHMQCGPINCRMKAKDINQEISAFTVIPRITGFSCEWSENANIYDVWPKLINDEKRNNLIVEDIMHIIDSGRFPIILTERREHLELLANMLKDKVECLAILYGGVKTKKRKEVLQELARSLQGKKKAILATGAYIEIHKEYGRN